MSPLLLVAIGLAGGLGATLRSLLHASIVGRFGARFPYGTLAVNLIGAFVLGVLLGVALDRDAYRLAGTGLIGAFTTFSTWAFESHRLGGAGRPHLGALNLVLSLGLGFAVCWAGQQLGASL